MGKMPRYEDIAGQIVGYIRRNNLLPGHKLPGGARLSAIFGVSKNVIFEALDYLGHEGIVEIRQSSGCYVTQSMWYGENGQPDWERFMDYRHKPPSTHILQKTRAVRSGGRLHLSILMTESSFGYNTALRGAMQDAMEDIGCSDKLITYTAHGSVEVREAVRERLSAKHIHVPTDQIVMAGNHDIAVDIVVRALFDDCRRGVIYAENFQIELLKVVLANHIGNRIELKALPADAGGPSAQQLKELLGGSASTRRALMLNPTRSAPYVRSISNRRRKEIYDICSEIKLPLVEIDRFGDLSPHLRPLKSMDKKDCVIHIGTLCCYAQLGIGTAWIVAPDYVIPKILDVSITPSVDQFTLNYAIVEKMLINRHYDQFMANLPRRLKERTALANRLLDRYMKDLADWNREMEYGMCWLKMRPGIDLDKMLAAEKDITFIPASFCESGERRHIYLSPCCLTEDELEYGIRALSLLAGDCMAR